MHGGHDAGLDRILVVQGLRHRGQAVGGAGSRGDDLVLSGQLVLVDGEHDGRQIVARRSGDDDLLGAGVDVGLRLRLAGVEAGALEHDVDIQLAPRQLIRLRLRVDGDLLAVHGDGARNLHGLAILFKHRLLVGNGILVDVRTLSGIILEQVSQHLRAGQIVDRNNLVALGVKHLTERQTADTTETINRNLNHWKSPPNSVCQ